jgi:UDP-glucuronate 4-epimerase
MNILITGAAGFIGSRVGEMLALAGHTVTGVDNYNDYYDPKLKHDRVTRVQTTLAAAQAAGQSTGSFIVLEGDITHEAFMGDVFQRYAPKRIVHLAAMAGVRYSVSHPLRYVDTNVRGTTLLLELAHQHNVGHVVYASTSSVYGSNTVYPFTEDQPTEHQLSPYAATKKATELMAHVYYHLYQLPVTGLRFFTVYGPWGRPDMGVSTFVRDILTGQPLTLYTGATELKRSFTYIDDIATGIITALEHPNGYQLLNIGGGESAPVTEYIALVEKYAEKKAIIITADKPAADVEVTDADTSKLRALGWSPDTPLATGVQALVEWYKSYHKI